MIYIKAKTNTYIRFLKVLLIKYLKMGFESVKKERSAKAWNFFNFDKSTEEAKCLICQKIMKAKGSTT